MSQPAPARPSAPAPNLAAAVEQVERDMIQTALDRAGGNISETARFLGLTRRGLYLKLRRLGLDSPAGAGYPLGTTGRNVDTDYSVSTLTGYQVSELHDVSSALHTSLSFDVATI